MSDYTGMSHQQLYELAHSGDPGRLYAIGDHWHQIGSDMDGLHAEFTAALAELAHSWTGEAATAFQERGARIGEKINQAATHSRSMGEGLHQMGAALDHARAQMPEPPSGWEAALDKAIGGAGKGAIAGSVAGGPIGAIAGALGGSALDDHLKAQHTKAVHTMEQLGREYTDATKKFHQVGHSIYDAIQQDPDVSPPAMRSGAEAGHGLGNAYAPYHGGAGGPSSPGDGRANSWQQPSGEGMHLAHENPPTFGPTPGPGGGAPTPPPGQGGGVYRPPADFPPPWRDGPSAPIHGDPTRPPGQGGRTRPGDGEGRGTGPGSGGDEGEGRRTGGRGPTGAGGFGEHGPAGSGGRTSGGYPDGTASPGGFGAEEGVFGGRAASGGYPGGGIGGADGISGGTPSATRMRAGDPTDGRASIGQTNGTQTTHEGESGMPMPPGGMGSGGNQEEKRGKRPSYLKEDPATWDVIGPYNPPVIE